MPTPNQKAAAATKYCPGCRERKPLETFSRNRIRGDGLAYQCMLCERDRKRNESSSAKQARKKRQRERHTAKVRARGALSTAVRRGTIVKPDRCEGCGERFEKRQLQGHHEDYSKPLDVQWLCRGCHRLRHSEEAANA